MVNYSVTMMIRQQRCITVGFATCSLASPVVGCEMGHGFTDVESGRLLRGGPVVGISR